MASRHSCRKTFLGLRLAPVLYLHIALRRFLLVSVGFQLGCKFWGFALMYLKHFLIAPPGQNQKWPLLRFYTSLRWSILNSEFYSLKSYISLPPHCFISKQGYICDCVWASVTPGVLPVHLWAPQAFQILTWPHLLLPSPRGTMLCSPASGLYHVAGRPLSSTPRHKP